MLQCCGQRIRGLSLYTNSVPSVGSPVYIPIKLPQPFHFSFGTGVCSNSTTSLSCLIIPVYAMKCPYFFVIWIFAYFLLEKSLCYWRLIKRKFKIKSSVLFYYSFFYIFSFYKLCFIQICQLNICFSNFKKIFFSLDKLIKI